MKFIVTSDWQIGMPFKFLSPDAQKLMSSARISALRNIAKLTSRRDSEIDFVLVCGDLIDRSDISIGQIEGMFAAIAEMAVPVYAIAGNHEWDGPNGTNVFQMETFRNRTPRNFHLLDAGVHRLSELPGVEILAVPMNGRSADVDIVSEALADLPPSDKFRVLAGHGQVSAFGATNRAAIDVSAIEDAIEAGVIDIACLGDRHSLTWVNDNPRICYPGTHEVTDFNELKPGHVVEFQVTSGSQVVSTEHRVGDWAFFSVGTPFSLRRIYSRSDLEELHREVQAIPFKDRTVLKLYLDSNLPLAIDAQLGACLKEWADSSKGGFATLLTGKGEGHFIRKVRPESGEDATSPGLPGIFQDVKRQLMAEMEAEERSADVAKGALEFLYRANMADR